MTQENVVYYHKAPKVTLYVENLNCSKVSQRSLKQCLLKTVKNDKIYIFAY